MNQLDVINMVIGSANLAFILKVVFDDLREIRYTVGQHLQWHQLAHQVQPANKGAG